MIGRLVDISPGLRRLGCNLRVFGHHPSGKGCVGTIGRKEEERKWEVVGGRPSAGVDGHEIRATCEVIGSCCDEAGGMAEYGIRAVVSEKAFAHTIQSHSPPRSVPSLAKFTVQVSVFSASFAQGGKSSLTRFPLCSCMEEENSGILACVSSRGQWASHAVFRPSVPYSTYQYPDINGLRECNSGRRGGRARQGNKEVPEAG